VTAFSGFQILLFKRQVLENFGKIYTEDFSVDPPYYSRFVIDFIKFIENLL
jgi:hypothetical protein